MGAISAPTRSSLVRTLRISIRDMDADEILSKEFWGLGWGSKADPQKRRLHLCKAGRTDNYHLLLPWPAEVCENDLQEVDDIATFMIIMD